MSNAVTTIAIAAKDDASQLETLWNAVKRLIVLWARKYHSQQNSRLYDIENLIQSGYLALFYAVRRYDPNKCVEFSSYLHYHIRRCFAEVSGHRGTKLRPELYADSLDEELSGDNDLTKFDILPDPTAHLAYDDAIERVASKQAFELLLPEIEKLEEQQRKTIISIFFEDMTYKQIAKNMNISVECVRKQRDKAISMLRKSRVVSRLANDFLYVSLTRFKVTHTSSVEEVILRAEQLCGGL